MKFTDLSSQKQEILRAFIAGDTIQVYTPSTSWKDTDIGNFFYVLSNCHHDWLRVKKKEPLIEYLFTGINKNGVLFESYEGKSIEDVNKFFPCTRFIFYIKRTFIDGVFVHAEVVVE